MGQWLRKPVVIIIIVVVVALVGFLVARTVSTESTTTKSNITTVTRGDLTTLVSGSSNIVAEQTVSLAFQSSGIVNTIAIKEGDTVNQGQVLATIDARDLEYQLASAKASYDSAKAN
jgi:HlyD family secretion protein